MTKCKYYLAIDIGASSGRHIIGYYDQTKGMITEEVYRFPNSMTSIDDELTWDIETLFNEVKKGIKVALAKYRKIESLAIDTWGVDYVLLDGDTPLLPVYAYRSKRTEDVIDEVHQLISFKELYHITGSQFQPFNTIYQFFADKKSGRLGKASSYLMIPEYLAYCLTGKKVNEYTNASTMGLLDLATNDFSKIILSKLGLNHAIFGELKKPGSQVGHFTQTIKKELGGDIKVILAASHDTASAVEGIPMEGNHPYISSGTWSLLGIKLDQGINSEAALNANFTNEYGPNYIRFQKNIMGLWIIQCLAKEMNDSFEIMRKLARTSDFTTPYDVNDPRFLYPEDMRKEIIQYYLEHKLTPPQGAGDIINATFYSLATSYKLALDELEAITNKHYQTLYIVGGGAKNDYLNEITEQVTKKKVIALPIEATALGNLKIQMENNHAK